MSRTWLRALTTSLAVVYSGDRRCYQHLKASDIVGRMVLKLLSRCPACLMAVAYPRPSALGYRVAQRVNPSALPWLYAPRLYKQ
jgi:hypothetical protein